MNKFGSVMILFAAAGAFGQSGRAPIYSESTSRYERRTDSDTQTATKTDDEIVRIETDLVTIPVQITQRDGRPVPDVRSEEFKVFENGVEQEIAYFSDEEQPFTVALVLDMSYSSVFKLEEIQNAAKLFVNQLRPHDKVMVVSFDEKARVLCEPTSDRKVLGLAIEGSKIASGTSFYDALDMVLSGKFRSIPGRKAVVLLTDGVDTTSVKVRAKDVMRDAAEIDALIYPIQYDTYDDVQKSRRKDAAIQYDENDRPYVVEKPRVKGERESDYESAKMFLKDLADQTGGAVYRVNSTTNLNKSFARIANELRKIYSLGYYPVSERKPGVRYAVKVRVYRPNLTIRARDNYLAEDVPK